MATESINRQNTQSYDALLQENAALKNFSQQLFEHNSFLRDENYFLSNENSKLTISLETAQQKNTWFENQIRLGKQRKFGKLSETMQALQLNLPTFDDVDYEEQISDDSAEKQTITYTRNKPKKPGRNIDTSQLPRKKVIHDLTEDEKRCMCGHELEYADEDVSEQLEVIPQQVYVVEHVTPKYVCRQCEKIKSAKKPLAPIPKALAGASLLTEVILSKYQYHLPLYRQSKILASLGVDIPDNTLGNWVMQAGSGLMPLAEALLSEINAARYLQVDETPVKVLNPEKKAFMWCYYSPLAGHRLVMYDFSLTRSAKFVEERLKDFKGCLQKDAYAGYNNLRQKEGVDGFGCLAHSRRRFVDVIKGMGKVKTGKAHESLAYINKLYSLERRAKEDKLSATARQSLREAQAQPILDKYHKWLEKSIKQVPPKSSIGQAVQYTLNEWDYLCKYVRFGEVEIDNHLVENKIRPFALGRRNWLFVGNESSAKVAALLYSLIQSCIINEINPRIYIHYVLTKIHTLRRGEISARDLLPHRINKVVLLKFAQMHLEEMKQLFEEGFP